MSRFYHQQSSNEKKYTPIQQKTFSNALTTFFQKEVPQIGGDMIIQLIVKRIEQMIQSYYPKAEHLSMGQLLWFAIDEDEKSAYGKSMSKTKIKPVVLTLIAPSDIEALKKGISLQSLKQLIIARLYKEAKQQATVLAQTDVGLITLTCLPTVSKLTKEYEKQFNVILPRRGTIHDLGRSVTHKGIICKKRKLENKSISQIARETEHAPENVNRYTTDLDRVQFCLMKKLSIKDISFVTKLSESLVIEYVNIIDQIKQQQKEKEQRDKYLPF
jgi:hypothetical protein